MRITAPTTAAAALFPLSRTRPHRHFLNNAPPRVGEGRGEGRRRSSRNTADKCADSPQHGRFTNPHTMQRIEVPSAGRAHFWVEFDLGNNLFPQIENGNLAILDPQLVSEAQRIFDQRFAQGCNWG